MNKISTGNQFLGKYYISRGFCKAKLEDPQGAIMDLTTGINFQEMLLKSIKHQQEYNYSDLGFGYLMRGLSKMMIAKASYFCDDLRKSIDLGKSEAIEIIRDYCN